MSKRTLAIITKALDTALKAQSHNVVEIGNLLIEARTHLEHGHWLPWLKKEFALSERSAENYVKAATFVTEHKLKSETVANLSPTALYRLGSFDTSNDKCRRAIATALDEARRGRVGSDRVASIIARIEIEAMEAKREAKFEQAEAKFEQAAADQAEAEKLLDGPPPDLPPSDPSSSVSAFPLSTPPVDLPKFDEAIGTLKRLQAKRLEMFFTTKHSAEDLGAVADFLNQIAQQMTRGGKADAA
jgi:hypothetical protein